MRSFLALLTLLVSAAASASNAAAAGAGHWSQLLRKPLADGTPAVEKLAREPGPRFRAIPGCPVV